MDIPGIGAVAKHARFGWYSSEPIAIAVLGGRMRRIIVQGYEDDPGRDEFHGAIKSF